MGEKREMKARAKMEKARSLQENWDLSKAREAEQKERKSSKKNKKPDLPILEEDVDGIFETDLVAEGVPVSTRALFDDDSEDSSVNSDAPQTKATKQESSRAEVVETEKDLFGGSSDDESDEELIPAAKRKVEDIDSGDEIEDSKKHK